MEMMISVSAVEMFVGTRRNAVTRGAPSQQPAAQTEAGSDMLIIWNTVKFNYFLHATVYSCARLSGALAADDDSAAQPPVGRKCER